MRIQLALILVFYATLISAQDIQIKGTVSSSSGIPLPGVNVTVKGTSKGTATDFDGNYSLNGVSPQDQIVFSYIGFQNFVVTVGTNKVINAALEEDSAALEEVVVIGYGTQTKKEVTGAVTVVGTQTIEELNPVRVEQALQGQVAGVNVSSQSGAPGSASTIQIRGISTNGDSRPLILVNGSRIEDLSVLNPNDIESINVIKDATAGIYGVQAANGVILITTKSGRLDQELKFELDAYTGIQQTSRRIPVLNATEYGLIVNEAFAAGGSEQPFSDISSLGEGTDWQDEVFQTAPIGSVNFGVTGGGEKSTYAGGVSFLTQDGIVGGGNSNFERATGRLSYGLNFLKNFDFNASTLLTQTKRNRLPENNLGSVLFNTINMAPTFEVRDENGDFTQAIGLGNEVINPLAQIANTFDDVEVRRINANVNLTYSFLEHFSAETRFQYNYAEVEERIFRPVVNYGPGKVFNVSGEQTSVTNVNGQDVVTVTPAQSNITEDDDIFRDYIWDNLVRYENIFNDVHDLKVLLGASVSMQNSALSSFTGFTIPDNSVQNASLGNALTVQDNFINGGDRFESRLLSYFTRLQYGFDRKYLLSVVLRRDGSSRFGSNNKFGYFPSASAGWVVSEEDFFGTNSVVNLLKLRASYGIIGNDKIGDFRYVSLLNGEGTYVFDNQIAVGVANGVIGNPDLKWEEQKTLDIGLDMAFAENKFDLTIDYFKKRTENLLVVSPVSGLLGPAAPASNPPFVNAGTVQNEGVEFAIGYSDNFSDNFKFNTSFNITYLKNEVLSVSGNNTFIPGGNFGVGQEAPSRMEAGKPIGYFFGLQADGIFQNNEEIANHVAQPNAAPGDIRFVDINDDNRIDSNDRVDLGNPIPDVTMGLNIGFTYKNVDFTSYTFASVGNDMVRNYERNQNLVNRPINTLNRWVGTGTSSEVPRVTIAESDNDQFSSYFVEDASYIRIQNIQVGYSVPSRLIEPLGVDKFRIYASVNNVYTFTEYSGYDPAALQSDPSPSASPIGAGIDQGFYPVPRTFLMGVNLKF